MSYLLSLKRALPTASIRTDENGLGGGGNFISVGKGSPRKGQWMIIYVFRFTSMRLFARKKKKVLYKMWKSRARALVLSGDTFIP